MGLRLTASARHRGAPPPLLLQRGGQPQRDPPHLGCSSLRALLGHPLHRALGHRLVRALGGRPICAIDWRPTMLTDRADLRALLAPKTEQLELFAA